LEQGQVILSAAIQAGFRESGAINLVSSNNEPATPMVAVRSMGLALDSIIGYSQGDATHPDCFVEEESLECLVSIANERFKENTKRIERFRDLLKKFSAEGSGEGKKKGQDGEEWEDSQIRRERKRAEGLMRSQQMKYSKQLERPDRGTVDVADLQLLDENA
jgi:tRNA wybutosine-synthesizing protein 3